MRHTILTFAGLAMATLCAFPSIARAATWQLDPAHSAAQFAVKHMGLSTVRGTFTKVTGAVQYDSSNVGKTSMEITIDAASVDTRVEMRDNDLRSDHFFDSSKYPTIKFKSTSVEEAGGGKLKVRGDLTIHGVTKPATLAVDGPSAPMKDPEGHIHIGAAATTTVNRADFGMSFMSGMIGNDVAITIDVELVKQ